MKKTVVSPFVREKREKNRAAPLNQREKGCQCIGEGGEDRE